LKAITDGLSRKGIGDVSSIVFNSSADIRVSVLGGRLEIKLGSEANIDYKIELVSRVINEEIAEDETGVIDASIEGTVSFLPM
jgi:hypothetical protein